MTKFIWLCLISSYAFGETSSLNLQLPGNSGSYQSDSFRTDNMDCSNSIGGATNLEFGVTGIIGVTDKVIEPKDKSIGVYARITIPLDGPKERINCNTLYKLELRKKRLEVEQLERELERLKALEREGFEN
jgi:hypothetical protein